MKTLKMLVIVLLLSVPFVGHTQIKPEVMEQIKALKTEPDPQKRILAMQKIIKENDLSEIEDAETIDMIKGSIAMSFLETGDHQEFEDYIFSMKNKFNQTSYLTMAAKELIRAETDLSYANELAKKALDLYYFYRDDPSARPEQMPEKNWDRFMKFAFYPYNDTYAAALYANGEYKEALKYQKLAFSTIPEEGILSSVERYAALLALNGEKDSAYNLLLNMAMTGKSTASMDEQLEKLYVEKMGSAKDFDSLMKKVAASVQDILKKKFAAKAMNKAIPDFTLTDLNGLQVSLSDFKGKVVVLDFWATWCLPCRASFPAMIEVMKDHPEVVFLFIATREEGNHPVNEVKKFLLENKYPFYVLMDEISDEEKNTYKALSIFKPQGIPAKIVIDKKGHQQFMSTGFSSDSELINELEAMISVAQNK